MPFGLPAERASMDEPLILDRYRLIERIAAGGSAEVWRARDEQLDRPVAVKRLHPHLLPDEASRRRLVAEARAAAALSHPVIVDVYDVDTAGESPALVMELVEGESLAARIEREGPLDERAAAALTADVADALYHAHQRGVIHRDVKPGNVLLAADGRTRLVDFGIAHSLAPSAERLTLAGTVMGTLRAMAPEQLTGGPITPRTDLYGLGVVLHEALTGHAPYPATSPVALADAQRAGPPAMDGIDPALASVIAACLSHDPTSRPLHAGALAAALRDWLAGDPAAALAMAPLLPVPVDTAAITRPMPRVAAPVVAAASAVPGPAARRRRSLAWPIAALAVVAVMAVAAAGVLPGIGPGADAAPAPSSDSASATPSPAWMAGLIGQIEAACGADSAAQAQAQADMAAMDEEAAADYAAERVAGCTTAGPGNGDGGGNGNADKGKGKGKKDKGD